MIYFYSFIFFQTLASLLSHIPLTTKGPAQITIIDIHALQERFYFSENVIPRYVLFHLINFWHPKIYDIRISIQQNK